MMLLRMPIVVLRRMSLSPVVVCSSMMGQVPWERTQEPHMMALRMPIVVLRRML